MAAAASSSHSDGKAAAISPAALLAGGAGLKATPKVAKPFTVRECSWKSYWRVIGVHTIEAATVANWTLADLIRHVRKSVKATDDLAPFEIGYLKAGLPGADDDDNTAPPTAVWRASDFTKPVIGNIETASTIYIERVQPATAAPAASS